MKVWVDAIYDSYAMCTLMGINFFEQDIPDATISLYLLNLLEEKISKLFFDTINCWAAEVVGACVPAEPEGANLY